MKGAGLLDYDINDQRASNVQHSSVIELVWRSLAALRRWKSDASFRNEDFASARFFYFGGPDIDARGIRKRANPRWG